MRTEEEVKPETGRVRKEGKMKTEGGMKTKGVMKTEGEMKTKGVMKAGGEVEDREGGRNQKQGARGQRER